MRACVVALLVWATAAHAQWRDFTWVDPSLRWRTLETQHFEVHFAEARRAQARIVAGVAETVYPRITGMLAWQPEKRIHLVLLDSADFANGYASPLPFNNFAVFLAPPDEGELLQNREWLELVMTHEFTHIVHLDKAHGSPYSLRGIFGRLALLFPNALEPYWITEGLAVYAESDPSRGYGRLGQSEFEGMMRAEAGRGFRSLREVNAEGRGFPLNRDYLYGGYFFAFVRDRYGPEAVTRLIETYSGNIIPFKVDSNPVQTTGKPMDALWLEYQDWLRARFAPKSPPSGAEDEAGKAIARAWAISSPVLAGGVRWYIQADGYTSPRLVRQAPDGAPETVRNVEQDSRLAAAPGGSLVMADPDICRNYDLLYDLYRLGPNGESKRLTQCGRFRYAAPLEDGRIAALRVDAGTTEVVILDPQGTLERSLYRAKEGEALSGLAARGRTVVATSLSGGRWSLIEVGAGQPNVLVSDEAVKHSPRFGESEDEIYFVAGYGKVYNVWSLRRGERNLSRWTASPTGVKEISAPSGGDMLLTTIEAEGDTLRLHRLPAAPLERRELPKLAEAPAPEPRAGLDVPDRPYSPWSSLRPTSWLPVIGLADGAIELGFTVSGQDALGLHQYVFTPRYEFTQDEPLLDAEYVYNARHGLLFSRYLTVKGQDDNNEITAYSIHERAQWVSTWPTLTLNRRFYWGLGAATERERLHQLGFDTTSVHDKRVVGLVGGLDTRRERFLSEGPSQGMWLQLFAETSNGLGGDFSGNVYRADWRGHLALGKTVLSLRWNEAYGQDKAEPFQLGGSFSDDLFILPVLNQREFALRGYGSGEPSLIGHRARLATVEWRTPLSDVDRHFMVPPVGLNRVSLNLFVDVGAAWEHDASPDYHRGVGAELMTEVRIGYLIGIQARAGIARGIDDPGRTTGYLRVGRSF